MATRKRLREEGKQTLCSSCPGPPKDTHEGCLTRGQWLSIVLHPTHSCLRPVLQVPSGKSGCPEAAASAAPTPAKAAAAASTADGSSRSPHQGSCSPPCLSSPRSSLEPAAAPQHVAGGPNSSLEPAAAPEHIASGPSNTQAACGSSLEALAAAAVAACQLQLQEQPASSPVPGPQQQQQQAASAADPSPAEAEAQALLWSDAAAAGWSQGFAAGSELLGPFRAQARAQTGSRQGMCRLGRVQHDGKLKGIWHTTNHRAMLYERVGWCGLWACAGRRGHTQQGRLGDFA